MSDNFSDACKSFRSSSKSSPTRSQLLELSLSKNSCSIENTKPTEKKFIASLIIISTDRVDEKKTIVKCRNSNSFSLLDKLIIYRLHKLKSNYRIIYSLLVQMNENEFEMLFVFHHCANKRTKKKFKTEMNTPRKKSAKNHCVHLSFVIFDHWSIDRIKMENRKWNMNIEQINFSVYHRCRWTISAIVDSFIFAGIIYYFYVFLPFSLSVSSCFFYPQLSPCARISVLHRHFESMPDIKSWTCLFAFWREFIERVIVIRYDWINF